MHSQAQKEAGFQADTVPGICLSVALQDIVAAPWGPGSFLLSMQTELRSVPDSGLGSAVVEVV